MNLSFKLVLTLVLFAQLITARAENSEVNQADRKNPVTTVVGPDVSPDQMLEHLLFHLQELGSLLSQQPQDMTFIKTETAWIRKQLRDLQGRVARMEVGEDKKKSLEKLSFTIDNMAQEVGTDDMLDEDDLQMLMNNYRQADQLLLEIE